MSTSEPKVSTAAKELIFSSETDLSYCAMKRHYFLCEIQAITQRLEALEVLFSDYKDKETGNYSRLLHRSDKV